MATLAVWCFASADAAGQAVLALRAAAPGVLRDAAVVEWPADSRRPRARRDLVDAGSLDDGFWGLFLGLVFFAPLLGAAVGAPTGATARSLADVGIDDHLINRVRDRVTPGTSALVVLESTGTPAYDDATLGRPGHRVTAIIDAAQEHALRAVFGRWET